MFKQNKIVIIVLASLCAIYNVFIYTTKESKTPIILSTQAVFGQQLWQEHNCWSCHQVYGLGGYLGPDLTNVMSHPQKGEAYVKAFLNSGIKSMPKFNFSDEEKNAIVSYLQYIDSTGYYPNHDAVFKPTGWVELKYKHNNDEK